MERGVTRRPSTRRVVALAPFASILLVFVALELFVARGTQDDDRSVLASDLAPDLLRFAFPKTASGGVSAATSRSKEGIDGQR
jgi:hypothetical protein